MTVHVTLVPHTHWDREWYEPFAVFSERLEHMMDTLLDLSADGFPHFHLDGQTAMIDDYLDRRPERAQELADRVAEGQLSAGPWVAQMDEFLTSGESHIRNLEFGLERARGLGRALEVGYMPDQFGHIGQMPQILRNGGIDRAMVWRGVPRSIETTTFRWRSPDGSEVTTEYMISGYSGGGAYEKAVKPAELAASLERCIRDLRPHLTGDRCIVMVGYDHAGPDATLPMRLAAAGPLLTGIEPRISGLAEHLAGQAPRHDLPMWTGELRSSARAHLLPNVYSARAPQKRERGRVEALLERYAEPLATLAPGLAWPGDRSRRAWTLLLWNGAHDSVCGCSHDQVARDVDARFTEVRGICEDAIEDALGSLVGTGERGSAVVRFNPSPFERDGVPALGYQIRPRSSQEVSVPVAVERLPGGDGVVVDGVPIRLFDEPDVGDLYTFCRAEAGQRPSPPERVEVGGQVVTATWDGLTVHLHIARAEEPFLRLDGSIRNDRPDHRLRLHVGLPAAATGSLAGSPFELVERPLVGEGGHLEAASATWPARHVAVAARTAILHEGVFEYEIVDGRDLAITLLRCVGRISAQELATRPWPAGPPTPTPDAQMLGETAFSLGVWRGAPADVAELLAGWERFALPVLERPLVTFGSDEKAASLLEVDARGAQLSTVRTRDGRLEVRVWNPYRDRTIEVSAAGRSIVLGPARIETLTLDPA